MLNIISTKHRRVRRGYWFAAIGCTIFLMVSSLMAQLAEVDSRLVISLYLLSSMPAMTVIGYLSGYTQTMSRRVQMILLSASVVSALATGVLIVNFSSLAFPAFGLMIALGLGSLGYAVYELARTRRWSSNLSWLTVIAFGGLGLSALAMRSDVVMVQLPYYVLPLLASTSGIGYVLGQRIAGYAAALRQSKRRTNKRNRRGRRR